jgi:hypothetical protein
MKKTILSVIILLAVNIILLTSCGEDKKESTTQNSKEATANMSSTEKPAEEEKIEPANITCKLFFKSDDIEEEDGTISKGTIGEREDKTEFLHKGIATRSFSSTFALGEHVEVESAEVENGLLKVRLKKYLPKHLQPKEIVVK